MAEYNGWTNYETWAVKLWMDNDEGSQELYREMSEQYRDNAHELARAIQDDHEVIRGDLIGFTACVFTDLLNAAMSEVNWYEIAGNLLQDLPELCDECSEEDTYCCCD